MKTIEQEKKDAVKKYGDFNSTHEVYGVLMEEVEEFWDIVKETTWDQREDSTFNALKNKKERMILELTQIAAVAQRAISELQNDQIKWV